METIFEESTEIEGALFNHLMLETNNEAESISNHEVICEMRTFNPLMKEETFREGSDEQRSSSSNEDYSNFSFETSFPPSPNGSSQCWQGNNVYPISLPLDNPFSGNLLEVILLHKPRGSQGIWRPVLRGSGLRVTKGKGKRLKLFIRCCESFEKKNVEVCMIDLISGFRTDNGFSIVTSRELEARICEVEVKLSRYFKRTVFLVMVKTALGTFQAKTVDFSSHNNGKATVPPVIKSPKIPVRMPDWNPSLVYSQTNGKQIPSPSSSQPSEPEPCQVEEQKEECEFASDTSSIDHLSDEATNPLETSNIKAPSAITIDKVEQEIVENQEEEVSVVNGNLDVNGMVKAKAFLQFSDIRLKANFSDIVNAMDLVTKLEGKTFVWRNGVIEENEGPKRVIGLIAQEVRKVFPEVVHEDPLTGLLSVSYVELIPVLIEAFKHFLKSYESDRKDVHDQLDQLRLKLDGIDQDNRMRYYDSVKIYRCLPQIFLEPVPAISISNAIEGDPISINSMGQVSSLSPLPIYPRKQPLPEEITPSSILECLPQTKIPLQSQLPVVVTLKRRISIGVKIPGALLLIGLCTYIVALGFWIIYKRLDALIVESLIGIGSGCLILSLMIFCFVASDVNEKKWMALPHWNQQKRQLSSS